MEDGEIGQHGQVVALTAFNIDDENAQVHLLGLVGVIAKDLI